MSKNNSLYFILINIAMLCVSTSGALGRFISLPPPLTIWSRAVVAFVLLFGYVIWGKKRIRLDFKKEGVAALLSGVLMAGHWVAYFFALQWSSVAIGMLSLFTYPMITLLLEPFFFDVRYQKRHLLLGIMILTGVYFLATSFELDNTVTQGVLMGMLSSFCYALRNILMKQKIETVDGSVLMLYQMGVTVLILLPALYYFEPTSYVKDLPYLLLLGIVTTAIGHTLFLSSFKKFSVGTVSIMSGIQPIYGILLGIVFLSEIPSSRSIIGGILIILTVLIEQKSTRTTPEK
ncbi:DMT family transporter [Flavobacteriaceae bacterium]|nr:DMT family transporter [Flavobacteriaceae bacterium]MDC3354740.1 DMT family transporter [Flavobacteriaceae bacterium]